MDELQDLTQDLEKHLAHTPRVQKWASHFAEAALKYRVPAAALDFALDLAAICDRESLGGLALYPPDASGCGDWMARVGHWLHEPKVKVIQTVEELPKHWALPKDKDGNHLPAPWAIADDDLGFGRGLMQLDRSVHPELMVNLPNSTTPLWADATSNILAAAKIHANNLAYFHGDKLKSFSAYNTGIHNVELAVKNGKRPDEYTTGHDYGTDCIKRRSQWVNP